MKLQRRVTLTAELIGTCRIGQLSHCREQYSKLIRYACELQRKLN